MTLSNKYNTMDSCEGTCIIDTLIISHYLSCYAAPSGNGVVQLFLNESTSSSYYYGIVQIWYNGQWGNICDDDDYDQYEADVICHQLGYTGASSYSRAGLMRYKILFYFLNQYIEFFCQFWDRL